MSGKDVLIIGPGYIGWNILELLVSEGYHVTGFVRRKEHAQGIEASGGKTVMGDLNDSKLITDETLKHDIVFHCATADHKPSVEAIVEGVAQRAKNGKSTIFIHTSGTSVLDDGAAGSHKGDKVYHDNVREEIDSVPDDAPHRPIDLAILKGQKAVGEAAKMAIMIPPTIYGFDSQHSRMTIQLPTLTRFAMKHGFSGHIGNGSPVESQIHFMDLARAYTVLLHWMEKADPKELLANPYFFCENGHEASWSDLSTLIGEGLYKAGKIASAEPQTIPKDLYKDLFGDFTDAVIGLNSRSRAVRLREMGWHPREASLAKCYTEDELPEILKEESKGFAGYSGTAAS